MNVRLTENILNTQRSKDLHLPAEWSFAGKISVGENFVSNLSGFPWGGGKQTPFYPEIEKSVLL